LNRAAAIAMRDGADTGLLLIDAILARGELANYYPIHSARGELHRRMGRVSEAAVAYKRALELVTQEPERRFLERRLAELGSRLSG
jgi:RNA polymerase sigma-70 factor (ECF subfamily)